MITEIEKSLKRFLKRKATINQSFITKFLITGTIAFSLTACGGGGGGGSSSGNNNTPVPPINPENPIEKPTNKPIEDVIGQGDIKNQNIIINGNISNDNISNKPAISALNSIIDNKATIELSGEKTTALQGTANTLLKGRNIEFSVTNNKDITLTGKNQTGIKVISINGKITGINNGNITVVKNIEKDDWDANDKFNEKYIENFAYGMVGLGKDSTIINKGNISINGSAIGMYTREGIAVNDGNINIKNDIYTSEPDKENYKVPIGMVAGEKGSIATNNGTISGEGHELQGMFAYNGGTVINSKTGKIILSNDSASGLNGFSSTVINDGEIRLTNGGNGIEIFEGSATNNGKISINGDLYNRGIFSENGDATNSGNISIESNFSSGLYAGLDDNIKLKEISLINESTGNIVLKGESNIGIESHVSNSNLINKGNIQLDGNNSTGLYSYGSNNTLKNSGTIEINYNNLKSPHKNSNISGILTEGNNNLINNSGIIKISANISAPSIKNQETFNYFYGIRSNNNSSEKNNNLNNSGDILIDVNNTAENYNTYVSGIHSNFSNTNIINTGKIIINAGNYSKGIYGLQSTILNSGLLEINGLGATGIQGNNGSIITNDKTGIINVNGNFARGIDEGSFNNNIQTILKNEGQINTTGSNNVGIFGLLNSKITNFTTGVINITGDYGTGIKGGNSQITNDGSIIITSNNLSSSLEPEISHSTGIYIGINDGTASAINNGNIEMNGNKSVGIYAYNGTIENNKKVSITGDMGTGLYISGNGNASNNGDICIKGNNADSILSELKSTAINNGNITLIGENNIGMTAENGGTVINEKNGTISVDGKDSYGMVARGGNSNAINKGTINIGASASGGMLADAGVISNEGIINIDKSHNLTDEEKNNFAMQAINGGTIKNFGTINTNGDITISSESNYIIGTTKDGNYGKISGENINLDGNITLDSTIASNDFKDTYILENIIESKNINLSENSKINSNSLLYDAHTEKNNSGNLDAKLTKNENSISDFTSKKYDHLSSLFDKSIDNKEFRDTLSDEAKNVLNDVFASTNTKENIVKKFKEISGEEYSNISRQIFDIKDIFKSYDNSIIDTLNNYSFNFNFIGNYTDVESKNNILGYNSKMSGIIGTSKLSESLYGVLGYGYSNLDFDNNSEGSIQSIHTGIYKDLKLNSFDLRMGIFGEYNFHKIERNVANNIAKGDFNSYILGLTTEISQKFGDSLYLKPSLNFDLSYGKYDSFSESGAKGYNLNLDSQDYTSFIPALEIKAGKIFKSAEIYSAIKYGYEFGHMNKNQNITFKEFGHYYLDNDNIENSQTNINIGASFELKNVSLNAEFGKEFGHRDSEYIKAGFSYTF
ncbi:hypothetical protein [Fusobacterium sp.]|uniref:hypothetical protein n=1 Tax=Fusobacterium sp. TaxID=68766 RepID=UPI00260944B0|nr:hypothetical protein [Fusobacterium sp.]